MGTEIQIWKKNLPKLNAMGSVDRCELYSLWIPRILISSSLGRSSSSRLDNLLDQYINLSEGQFQDLSPKNVVRVEIQSCSK